MKTPGTIPTTGTPVTTALSHRQCRSHEKKKKNVCPFLVLSWVSVGLQVAMTTGTNPKLRVAHEQENQVVRSAGAADGETEWKQQSCAPEAKLVELSTTVGCGGSPSGRLRLGL